MLTTVQWRTSFWEFTYVKRLYFQNVWRDTTCAGFWLAAAVYPGSRTFLVGHPGTQNPTDDDAEPRLHAEVQGRHVRGRVAEKHGTRPETTCGSHVG